jgi:hypothetical protein
MCQLKSLLEIKLTPDCFCYDTFGVQPLTISDQTLYTRKDSTKKPPINKKRLIYRQCCHLKHSPSRLAFAKET